MLLKRLALLPLLILVYALVAEAGLQIASFFLKKSTRADAPSAWITGDLRVLCLGDSNTYGLWVDRSETYPEQLEAVWNERVASPRLEALNLGFPGTNSSRVVRELPRMLETFDPDVVIVMVGVNDFWTLPTPLEDEAATRPTRGFLARHSLLYRVYYLFQRGRQSRQMEILLDPEGKLDEKAAHKARVGDREFEMGFVKSPPGEAGNKEDLRNHLLRLIAIAREAERPLYLMTYPMNDRFYHTANRVIEAVAEETGTPLIDLTAVFKGICPRRECPAILFPDGHPKAPGYRIVAEAIARRLERRGDS
jgi:lysophospholipase L1-like esterase